MGQEIGDLGLQLARWCEQYTDAARSLGGILLGVSVPKTPAKRGDGTTAGAMNRVVSAGGERGEHVLSPVSVRSELQDTTSQAVVNPPLVAVSEVRGAKAPLPRPEDGLRMRVAGRVGTDPVRTVNLEKRLVDWHMAVNGKMSNNRIGQEYERMLAYQAWQRGYWTRLNGAWRGKSDHGVDLVIWPMVGGVDQDVGLEDALVASRESRAEKVMVIQAKCWGKRKRVRENVINALHGAASNYQAEVKPFGRVQGVLYSSTEVSSDAAAVAARLGIRVVEGKRLVTRYPMVKCLRDGGFLLPWQDLYDAPYGAWLDGYVGTVTEAEGRGYRYVGDEVALRDRMKGLLEKIGV